MLRALLKQYILKFCVCDIIKMTSWILFMNGKNRKIAVSELDGEINIWIFWIVQTEEERQGNREKNHCDLQN